uniref:Nuclease HARBI1 n=1 Tax=Knipowitschia caucasica TaxID=637954 RepID=A0AAV2JBD5_KNICA
MAPAINRRRIAAALLLSRRRQRRITRSWWVHPLNQRRASHGAFYHLVAELQLFPDRYHSYFRMSVAKMEELLSIVGPEIQMCDTNYRDSIDAKQRLAVTIRFLASGESFRSLAFQYRLGRSTTANIVHSTLRAIEKTMIIGFEDCIARGIALQPR